MPLPVSLALTSCHNNMKQWLFVFALLISFSIIPHSVFAVELGGLNQTAATAGIQNAPANPKDVVAKILAQGISLVGIIFFGLILWAGFLWMTAMGNEQQVDEAKNIILAAVIGLIIVAAAYAITKFVGGTLLNGNG